MNGCWDNELRNHLTYGRYGYNSEFVLSNAQQGLPPRARLVTTPGVEHTALYYMDVLSGTDRAALLHAADQLLSYRLATYHRLETAKKGSVIAGTPKPATMFGVTVFASAKSDRLPAFQNGEAIGEWLGTLGAALCTGGGDQHLMYAPLVGYMRTRRPGASHFSCASTHDIVKVETKFGRLPPCDYSEMHDNITPRYAMLERTGDMYISIGGGDGTGQETGKIILRKLQGDAAMLDKAMLFVGDSPSMEAEIAGVLGTAVTARMKRDPFALAPLGIYWVPNAAAAEPIIRAEHARFMTRHIAPHQRKTAARLAFG